MLGTLSHGWADFIRFLDVKISGESLTVRYSKIGAAAAKRVTFAQLQQLNEYSDLLIRISHALDLNVEVLDLLAREATTREVLDSKRLAPRYDAFRESLWCCATEHTFLKHHVGLVRDCAERLGFALRDTIALQDSNTMVQLTHKTIYEAQSMKTLTLVALVFIPASFTAAFLSMGYISVDSLEGIMSLKVSVEMWFYLAITLPLMFVTLVGWWIWEKRIR